MMNKRIQRKRTKGWRMPPNTVYVGRPTKWGNPNKVPWNADNIEREIAVENYRSMLLHGDLPFSIEDVRKELAGKDLACWCFWSRPCHADVLLEIANED